MDFLIGISLVAATAIGGLIGSIVANELYDRSAPLARWLLSRAVIRLPELERERYREEWNAHLAECGGNIAKIYFALGCMFAASRILASVARRPCNNPSQKEISSLTEMLNQRFEGVAALLTHANYLKHIASEIRTTAKCLTDDQLMIHYEKNWHKMNEWLAFVESYRAIVTSKGPVAALDLNKEFEKRVQIVVEMLRSARDV